MVIQIAQPQLCTKNLPEKQVQAKSDLSKQIAKTAKKCLGVNIEGKDVFESIISWPADPPPPAPFVFSSTLVEKKKAPLKASMVLTLSYLGGGRGKIRSLLFFLHHPKTAQGIKLKLSDFKDTPLTHLFQVKPVRYILSCCHGNKITKGTSQNLAPKISEKSVICKDIELKFGIEATFVPLSSKSNIFTI